MLFEADYHIWAFKQAAPLSGVYGTFAFDYYEEDIDAIAACALTTPLAATPSRHALPAYAESLGSPADGGVAFSSRD